MTEMLRKKNRAWTEEDDRRLFELRAAGRSSISIAAALERSTKAVDRRLSDLKARTRSAEVASAGTASKPDAPHGAFAIAVLHTHVSPTSDRCPVPRPCPLCRLRTLVGYGISCAGVTAEENEM
jgi:hypothetical protein